MRKLGFCLIALSSGLGSASIALAFMSRYSNSEATNLIAMAVGLIIGGAVAVKFVGDFEESDSLPTNQYTRI